MPNTPADTAGRTPRAHKPRGHESEMEARRDVLAPNLRAEAKSQGRDPEEVDPIQDDEDTLRRASFGGGSALD